MLRLRGVSSSLAPIASRPASRSFFSLKASFSSPSTTFRGLSSLLLKRQYYQPLKATKGEKNDQEHKWWNFSGVLNGVLVLGVAGAALEAYKWHKVNCEEKEVKEAEHLVSLHHVGSESPLIYHEPTTSVEKADVSRFWRDVFLPDLPLIVSL